MKNGYVYFNSGMKCLPRLLVSISSLLKVTKENILLISMGDESNYYCKQIADHFQIGYLEVEQTLSDKHYYWLEKARIHEYSPFVNTIFLDSDTIILKDPSSLFDEIKKSQFVATAFSNWNVNGKIIRNRLIPWGNIDSELLKHTFESKMPSINVGVFGFNRNSELMKNWFNFTYNIPDATLPEESSCHLLLNKYPSKIVNSVYNYSCKYEVKPVSEAIIIHYHGRKHCRLDSNNNPLYNADKWIKEWNEIFKLNICNINSWVSICGDNKLNKYRNIVCV